MNASADHEHEDTDHEQQQTHDDNLQTFKECVSTIVISKLNPTRPNGSKKRSLAKGRKSASTRSANDNLINPSSEAKESVAGELSDFTEYLAGEIFLSLPGEIRTLSYAAIKNSTELDERYSLPLAAQILSELAHCVPRDIIDSLSSYNLIPDDDDIEVQRFLDGILASYLPAVTQAPPEHTPTQATECEICERDQLPLTYHHLIPRQMHAKAVKRGWHAAWEVQKVAWLCRACHSYVHRILTNEELAREYFSVDRLLDREDIQRWAQWIGRIRWKAR